MADVAGWLGATAGVGAIVAAVGIAAWQAKAAAAAALTERKEATRRAAADAAAALVERKEATRRAAWSAAMAAYQGYLELGVRHPKLANGGTVVEDEPGSYRWYLTALCFAAEQILRAYDSNTEERRAWIDVLFEQFQRHQPALNGELYQTLGERRGTFSEEVNTLIGGGRPPTPSS